MNSSAVDIIAMHLNDYLMKSKREFLYGPVPHITCRDGTVISVQAGGFHYCRPKSIKGPWTHVEVMMMSSTTPVHFDYPECDVAGYVPIESVAREILSRGNMLSLTQQHTETQNARH